LAFFRQEKRGTTAIRLMTTKTYTSCWLTLSAFPYDT